MKTRGIIKRGIAFVATFAAALAVALPAQALADWQPVAGAVTQSRSALRGYDLKRIGGVPYVAWSESNGHNYVVRVARLDSGSGKWLRVGGPVNLDPSRDAHQPSLAAGPDGTPWVAWTEADRYGVNEIRAAHLSTVGSRWIEPDSRDFAINYRPNPGQPWGSQSDRSVWYADTPQLIFYGHTPYITYLQDNPSEYEVDVVRLAARGHAWERVSRYAGDFSIPRGPRAAIFDNALFLGVTDGFIGVGVSRRGSDHKWTRVGGLVNAPPGQGYPDQDGRLDAIAGFDHAAAVTWSTYGASPQVYVSRYDGHTWEVLGGGPMGDGHGASLRVVGGRLYAATTGRDLTVRRLSDDGKSWVDTAGALNANPVAPNTNDPLYDRPVLTGVDGTPYVAWSETDGTTTSLRVARLEGAPSPAGADDGDGSDLGATPPAGDDESPNGHENPPPPVHGPCGFVLMGSVHNDSLLGTSGRDTIRGLAGDDVLRGLAGNDCLFGGDGRDTLLGGAGADVLHGGSGNDVLRGGGSEDRLYGDSGNDRLYGGADDDQLYGGPGNDVLVGGPGFDRFSGGAGNDVIYSADGRAETVDCGRGFDTVHADRFDRLHGCERVKIEH